MSSVGVCSVEYLTLRKTFSVKFMARQFDIIVSDIFGRFAGSLRTERIVADRIHKIQSSITVDKS